MNTLRPIHHALASHNRNRPPMPGATYTAFHHLDRHPELTPSPTIHHYLDRYNGLNRPILLTPTGKVLPSDLELFEGFARLIDFYGPAGTAVIPTRTVDAEVVALAFCGQKTANLMENLL